MNQFSKFLDQPRSPAIELLRAPSLRLESSARVGEAGTVGDATLSLEVKPIGGGKAAVRSPLRALCGKLPVQPLGKSGSNSNFEACQRQSSTQQQTRPGARLLG